MIRIFPLIFLFVACSMTKEPQVQITSFNFDWFCEMDGSVKSVTLPHTPRIEPLVVNDQWQGKLVYTKVFVQSKKPTGKTILHFEGVMHATSVFFNGEKIKEHVGGYLPFSVDLTDYLKVGENELRLEVLNTDNSTIPPGKPLKGLDFNYYGGIYRDVWLIRKKDVYITDPFLEDQKDSGMVIHFDEVSENQAIGTLQVHLRNDSYELAKLAITANLSLEDQSHDFIQHVKMAPQHDTLVRLNVVIDQPSLWSTTTPSLYDLTLKVSTEQGAELDRMDKKVGIRKIELTENGFFLNGEKQYLRGTNRHQEYPFIGYALSNNANYRDALKIKNAGFDFVRLSHYPQDEAFLDACDALGILVMDAIPGWQHYEEGKFVENSFQNIRDMVRRDRNHPSVVFWEVSLNESGMTDTYMVEANRILKEELPYTDTYSAGWMDHLSYDLFIPARQHSGPLHYWNFYKNGNRKILIAEYGDWEYYAHNAGFNQTAYQDLSEEERNSRQLRASGEKRLMQQALNFQEAANSNRHGIGTIGHANWLMFDYNRGYADDLEASGISDIFRIPKFAFHFYRSQRPVDETVAHPLVDQGPMIKIASYWTKESSLTVRVFSNCDAVELFLNDTLIQRKSPQIDPFSDALNHPPFVFELKDFKPGTLRANGYLDGKRIVSDSVVTPGQPYALKLVVDTLGGFEFDSDDVYFVYCQVLDKNGMVVSSSDHLIKFLLADGGEVFGENPVKAEAGIATVVFRGNLKKLKLQAESSGLISDSLGY